VGQPTALGSGVKAFLASSFGLAMRSLPRAVPLLTLGLAVMAGMGIAAIGAWTRRMARPLAVGVTILAIGCLPPLWTGNMVAKNLQRPEQIPTYWEQDAHFLDTQGRGQGSFATRVLELPGSDFASYRWGNTVDPILPGMMSRPYVSRELIPYGTPISADLLDSFDGQLQEGVLSPAAIAPIARFMGVGDINLRSDLQYERYNLARPRQTWRLLTTTPGLGRPTGFGGNAPNIPDPTAPLNDEEELASPPTSPTRPRSPLSRSRAQSRSCEPSPRPRRSCSPAAARGWWTRRERACCPDGSWCCTRDRWPAIRLRYGLRRANPAPA